MQINIINGTLTRVEETLIANSGYTLPSTISVSGANSSYDSATGLVVLTNLSSNISLTATGESSVVVNQPLSYGNKSINSLYIGAHQVYQVYCNKVLLYYRQLREPSLDIREYEQVRPEYKHVIQGRISNYNSVSVNMKVYLSVNGGPEEDFTDRFGTALGSGRSTNFIDLEEYDLVDNIVKLRVEFLQQEKWDQSGASIVWSNPASRFPVNINTTYCKNAWLSTDSQATSGFPTGTRFAPTSIVYGFVELDDNTDEYTYSAQSDWVKIDERKYRVGSLTVTNGDNTFTAAARRLNNYTLNLTGENCKDVYSLLAGNADGHPSGYKYPEYSTVYYFATLEDDTLDYVYSAPSNWILMTDRTYMVGSVVMTGDRNVGFSAIKTPR